MKEPSPFENAQETIEKYRAGLEAIARLPPPARWKASYMAKQTLGTAENGPTQTPNPPRCPPREPALNP
jgi:hypothetical protein